MKPEQALAIPDGLLADMYSYWSEDTYCAWWTRDGEEEFVRWLLSDERGNRRKLTNYQMESIKTIRELLTKEIE